jgi:intraflagellar transport protein 172
VIVDEEGVQVAYALSEELICFTSALQKKELKTCVGILETMSKSSQSQTMWQELQEISLKNWNLPIAERCAAALGNISEARYLRKVLKIASKSNINGGINDNDWEVRAKILQLNKEFTEAERIYLSHNRIDDAILMYENLTLFVDALRIAETTNHPDFEAKKDSYFQWLLENNQEEKAAQIKESYGDNIRAISIYLDAGFPGKAAHLIHDKDIVHPQHLLESVAAALIDAELLKESGKIYERMGQFQKALSYYTEGLSFREALNLAMSRIPSKVVAIEELWGDHLFLSGHYALSIDHFVDAHVLPKAIEAAISAQMWDRASEMIRRLDDSSPNTLGKIASKFVAVRRFEDAKVLFLKAGMNRSVILMYIQNGLWDKLSEEAIDLLTEDELYNIYSKEAERMVNDDKLNEAEKLYLLLNRPQEAIEVWKRAGRYDEALALVSSHCYDLYEETNQFVAKEKEKCGQLNEAESFYVASGDWLGAVEMYRTRDMWDDAIRVAKLSMEKEILDRVAYDYSIHLGEKAHEVLSNLDIFSNAIRFAVNSEEFENALDLASNMGSEKMLGGIHLKFAHSLEHDGKYEEAANEYIKAGNISDAIDMYIHLRGWNDAEKIARVHNPNYLNAIHMAHAEDAVQSKDFVTAERCFITAVEAEKALLMYRKNELWKDALRVAQEHVPRLSDQLQISLEESMNQRQNETSKACFIHNARALEEAERFDEAIDAYLRPQSNSSLDPLDLEDLWDNAIRLVNERCPQRIQTVSKDVASRLCQVGLLLKAAEVLSQSDQVGSAVEILIEAKHWEQAKVYAHGHPHLTKSFINAYEKWLVDNGDYNELLLLGQTKTAFDMMMNNGDWDSIWETLHNQKELNPGSFVQYTVIRINELLQNCDIPNILSILAMILEQMAPLPDYQIHFDLYLRITQKILCFDKDTEESCDYCTMLKKLKSVLLLTLEKYKSNSQHDMEVTASFIHLLMTVHYSFVMELCTKNNLLVIACKCSLTLLRYSVLEKGDGDIHTLIPADKIFYKAGILCKEICNERLTFMMLNRYVDILEAMEENDFTDFAHDDFERTNIPCDTNHPSVHYISSEERREEIRDWVLGACIDSTIERSLPLPEDAIRGELHEGLYENDRDQCIVTGYPIPDGKLLTMETCKCNKDDWDSFFNTFDFHPWSVREG